MGKTGREQAEGTRDVLEVGEKVYQGMRESMVFYRSFFEAVKGLDAELYKEILNATFAYAMDDEIPTLSPIANALFQAFKPQIDANNRRYENGCKGGRPITKTKPNNNQTITKVKPNDNDNENVNDNEVHYTRKTKRNKFSNFKENDIDFDDLQKNIFSN